MEKKLQEIQKQDLDEVSGNAEKGNEFSTRFREMLKTETRTRSFQMSQNNDLGAKTRYRCRLTTLQRLDISRVDIYPRDKKWFANGPTKGKTFIFRSHNIIEGILI